MPFTTHRARAAESRNTGFLIFLHEVFDGSGREKPVVAELGFRVRRLRVSHFHFAFGGFQHPTVTASIDSDGCRYCKGRPESLHQHPGI